MPISETSSPHLLISYFSPVIRLRRTNRKPVCTETHGIGIVVVKAIYPSTEVHSVDHHKEEIEPVDEGATEY
jgi:hypothetical protein